MKLRTIITTAVVLLLAIPALAQDNTPKRGQITLAATVGYNSYTNVTALPGNLLNYSANAQSTSWTDKQTALGFEFGWFVGHKWKLSLAGGAHFSYKPAYSALPGTVGVDVSMEDNWGEIPNYLAVEQSQNWTYNAVLGFDRYLGKMKNLKWFVGLRAGFAYTQDAHKDSDMLAMGMSLSETWNVCGAIALGAEYFFSNHFYLGLQVHPFSYTYSVVTHKPQEGLAALSADSHNFGCFAAPTLKVGFMF